MFSKPLQRFFGSAKLLLDSPAGSQKTRPFFAEFKPFNRLILFEKIIHNVPVGQGSLRYFESSLKEAFVRLGRNGDVCGFLAQRDTVACEITWNNRKQKSQHKAGFSVVLPGFEPGTHGFSIRCSTN